MSKTYEQPSREFDNLFDFKPPKIEWINPNHVMYCQCDSEGMYKTVMIDGRKIVITKEQYDEINNPSEKITPSLVRAGNVLVSYRDIVSVSNSRCWLYNKEIYGKDTFDIHLSKSESDLLVRTLSENGVVLELSED